MKKILLGAAALSLLAPTAFAQQNATVTVGGAVTKQCGLGNQSGGGTGTADAVALGAITDANGFLSVAPRNIGFGNVWCNSPATVTLTPSALDSGVAVADTSSFVNKLDLIVDNQTGTGGSVFAYPGAATSARTGAAATNAMPAAFETGTGRFSQARLSVALPAGTVGNDRPVAGTYSGTVILSVNPS